MQLLFLIPQSGDAIQIEGDQASVGRRPECEVRLADTSVSRLHARLEERSDGWHVIDNGSANGTFLDEQQVDDALLVSGSELRFGDLAFRVELRDDAAAVQTVQLATPRGLRFDEPARKVRRPPAPPAAAPTFEAPTIHAQPASPGGMTEEIAGNLLGLPAGASVTEGRRRYQQMFNDYQVRVTNAPTAALRRMYQRNLSELRQAFETLFPGHDLP